MKISHRRRQPGEQRLNRRFLWLPLTLGDETRWLEKACICQEYTEETEIDAAGGPYLRRYWQDKYFYYG
jgi:hypothetical protein